jgi:crotonobetainyl-CoA:carnitine CoA-transferase CaiB-like acyl-CoA transferase
MSATARKSLDLLLERAGLGTDAAAGVTFSGDDPVVSSRLRYGAATASALAANAAGVAALWQHRTGRGQRIGVDLARAVHVGLRTTFHLRQNGHAFRVGSWTRGENFFRTADNRIVYLLRNNGRGTITQDLVGLLRASNDTVGIAEAVRGWRADELETALAERKLPGVIVRQPEEWLAHEQGQWLAARPGFSIEKIGDSPAEPLGPAKRPLDGLRVLDASHVIAGPAVGRLLAEQGGDVLHVANPAEQETIPVHIDTGFGKRSAFIDLNRVDDVGQLRRLAQQADIFIQSWRPGALQRRGFGPETLAALRPGIIYVSISCYGHEGPWAERGGYEPIGQAVSGLCTVEGTPEAPRNAPTVTMNDFLAAYLAGAGIMGALLRRCREGGSYHVSTSLAQASMWVLQQGLLPARPDAPEYTPGPDDLDSRDCAFGCVIHARPVARYSDTPAYWDPPPQPAGASLPQWVIR